MKKILEIALGIVTSVGGFLEIGSIATAAQAGSDFSFQLIWAIVLGGICIIFLVEQAGRFAAVSGRTIPDAIRERFGFNYFAFLYLVLALVSLIVLAAEIGGVCIALELATDVSFQWWAIPVALVVWLIIWKGTFGVIEKGVSVLGLVTLSFVVGAVLINPPWSQVAQSALPSLPQHNSVHYWFIAVSILGATISPYLYFFYSSGAIEDEWNEGYVGINRIIATGGTAHAGFWILGLLVHRGVHRDRMSRRSDGDHARDCVSHGAGFWLELEREPATARRSALQRCVHDRDSYRHVAHSRWHRSADADDLRYGVDSGNAAGVDRAVSLLDERLQLRACLS
jgi:hypothetical protein